MATAIGETHSQRLPPKPRDLKLSCDFCALSKVKCDRGRPECQRCIRHEVKCHYSRSRRVSKARQLYTDPRNAGNTGKEESSLTPWSQQVSNEVKSCQSQGAQPGALPESSELSIFTDLFDVDHLDTTGGTRQLYTDTGQPGHAAEDEPFIGQWTLPNLSNPGSSDGPSESHASLSLRESLPKFSDFNTFMDLTSDDETSLARLFASDNGTIQSNNSVSPTSSSTIPRTFDCQQGLGRTQSSPCDGTNVATIMSNLGISRTGQNTTEHQLHCSVNGQDEGHCIKRACAILESLSIPVLGCPRRIRDSSSSQSSVTSSYGLDVMLRTNQVATDNALAILPCPCANTRGILSILVLIGKQIMESYWNLLQQQFRCPLDESSEGLLETSSSATDGNSNSNNNSCGVSGDSATTTGVSNVPIAIGGYVLDVEVSKQVLLQVLRLEMGKMARFIEILLHRDVPREMRNLLQSFRAYQERLVYVSQNQA